MFGTVGELIDLALQRAGPDIDEEAVIRAAYRHYPKINERGALYQADFEGINAEARRVEEGEQRLEKQLKTEVYEWQDKNERKITEAELLGRILNDLHALRDGLSKIIDLTFESSQQAARWIESIYQTRTRPTQTEREKADRLTKNIQGKCRQVEKLLHRCDGDINVHFGSTSLFYNKKPGSGDISIPLFRESPRPLVLLAKETSRMARETGFSEASLVNYVLTGKFPELPTARVTRRFHQTRRTSRVYSVVVFNADMKKKDLQQLYELLSAHHNIRSRESITEKDLQFLGIVAKHFGDQEEPQPSGQADWGKIAKDLLGSKSKWDAAKHRWYRLKNKLKNPDGISYIIRTFYVQQKTGRDHHAKKR